MKKKLLNKLKFVNISSEFVPYACHYNNETILTKSGEILQIIKIVGFNHEILENTIDLRTTIRDALSSNIKQTNFSFWIHTVRRKLDLDPGGEFPYYFTKEIHEAWCKKNYWHDKYVNELYVTIVYRNIDLSIPNIVRFLKSFSYRAQEKYYEKEFEKSDQILSSATNNILKSLSKYGAKKLTIVENEKGPISEQLQFFGKIIHLSESDMPLPIVDLSKYLSGHKIAFGNVNFEIKTESEKQFGTIFSVKEYHDLSLKELDKFLQLPQEMVITQSINFTDSKSAFKKFNYQKYILEISGDTEFAEISGLDNMLKDLDDAPTDFGNNQLTIMIMAKSLNFLDEHIKKSIDILSDLGLLIVREDLNLENCFWSQLPSNFKFLVRNFAINTKFIAGFASLYNFPAGRINSKWGRALTLFRTALGTPYFLNFHVGEIGHNIIIGPKTSGKNTLVNFLLSESCKYNPNIYIFDYNNKTELLINAIGKKHISIDTLSFDPFDVEDNVSNRNFLCKWLMNLFSIEDKSVNSAINKLFLIDRSDRSINKFLDIIKESINRDDVKVEIDKLINNQKYIDIFSNRSRLNLDNIIAFETNIVIEEKIRNALISYLIYSINNSLDGNPTIIVINNIEMIRNVIDVKEWLESLTKKNAIAIISIDNDLEDVIENLIDYIPTRIFLPNEELNEDHKNKYNLNDQEFHMLKNIKSINRQFLLKQSSDSIIAELNLTGIKDVLSILTSNNDHINYINSIKKELGDDPQIWLPKFFENLNLK